MPKLVRSRNYHSLSVPSSPSSLTSPHHAHGTNARSIPCLSYYSPMTPPWDTTQQHHQQQQRTVSEEDMRQNHTTTTSIGSRKDDESRDGCSSRENGCNQRISHSLSSVSSASSSTTSTTNLKRRKPSVCLTDLVQQENKESACIAAVSPIMTNLNHCSMRTMGDPHHTSPSGWWGHFTTTASGDDCFATELDDEEQEKGILNVVPLNEENWDYSAMAHATSFIPLQRPYRHNHCYYNNFQESSYMNRSLGDSGSNSSTTTSWRVALTSSYHPYMNKNRYPMMKRQSIRPLSSTFQKSSDYRCIHPEQQLQHPPHLLQSSSSSLSSSSFDEFLLVCPSNHSDDSQTESSMDIATKRMSVLGL